MFRFVLFSSQSENECQVIWVESALPFDRIVSSVAHDPQCLSLFLQFLSNVILSCCVRNFLSLLSALLWSQGIILILIFLPKERDVFHILNVFPWTTDFVEIEDEKEREPSVNQTLSIHFPFWLLESWESWWESWLMSVFTRNVYLFPCVVSICPCLTCYSHVVILSQCLCWLG
jgi:hypothetical protein